MSKNFEDRRRFSFGGDPFDLKNVAVWKFDVQIQAENVHQDQTTAYVKHAARTDAYRAFFALHSRAKIFGTGMPLSEQDAEAELGRVLRPGEILLVDEL